MLKMKLKKIYLLKKSNEKNKIKALDSFRGPSKEYWWGYHKYYTLPQVLCLNFFGGDQWMNQEIDFTSNILWRKSLFYFLNTFYFKKQGERKNKKDKREIAW